MITKQSLTKTLNNPANKVLAIDMDGTICEGEFWGGKEPEPIQKMIDYVLRQYKRGAHIIIYTARQPAYYQATHAWLLKYGVPFHGIAMQMKPGADVYIDDKAVHPSDLDL